MAPALQLRFNVLEQPGSLLVSVRQPGTHETQAARRHGHFGLKSAPQHRDFTPGKEGDSK